MNINENNTRTLDLKEEKRNVTEYKFFNEDKFKNLSSEAKNLFVTTLLNSFLEDLKKTDSIYRTYNKNNCLPPDQMLEAMNECYINFYNVLKSFSETDKGYIKLNLNVLEELIVQLFGRDKSGYLTLFLTKLIKLPGFDKTFVNYVKNILSLCDANLLDKNGEYADIVNQAVENKNQDQIDFIRKLMKYKYSCFFHRDDHNFITKLTYDTVIIFGKFMNIRAINCLSEDYVKRMFENTEHRKILEEVLKKQSSEETISMNKYFGHDTEELELLSDYEFMKFGDTKPAKELPAWLLKIKENDNLQDDNFPQFTFQTLIIPDNNVGSVFIKHDINVRVNKLLTELLNDVKDNDNNPENAEKYIDTKRTREVFVNIYCLIRKYAQHNLEIRIDKEIINSIVGKTKKEDLKYLATCFNNFSSFSSFGQLTQKKFKEARKKCLDLMEFNSNDFLQKLESDEDLAETIFLSNKIQKLNVNSLILKANKLRLYPSCLLYLSNQQINDLAIRQDGLEIIKDCLNVPVGQNKIFHICKEDNVFCFKHIEKKLNGMTPQLKKLFIETTINSRLERLSIKVSDYIRNRRTIIIGSNDVMTTYGPEDQARLYIIRTFCAIATLMRHHDIPNDLNIEMDYFVLDTLTNKIPANDCQIYLQQLQRIIELPGCGKKTLYYLTQIINFLSFGHLFSQNSLMAKIRNNPQGPVPRTENDNLNIQQ